MATPVVPEVKIRVQHCSGSWLRMRWSSPGDTRPSPRDKKSCRGGEGREGRGGEGG